MKKIAIKFFALLLLATSFAACKKDYGNQLGPLQDSVAPIPVTVTNQEFFERFPVVTTKVDTTNGSANSTGTFSIIFNAVRDYSNRLNAAFATLPAGSTMTPAFSFGGTSTGGDGTLTPNTSAQTPNQLRFFFLLTLEDGKTLITTEVDVRLL